MYTFIQQGFVKYNKSDNNVIYNLTKYLYFKSILLFLLITESRKKWSVSTKHIKSTTKQDTTVKIDTKLFIYFSEQQISIQNHQSNAENPDLHHRNQFNLKCMRMQFNILFFFTILLFITVFLIHKL